jgi:hypothetical protein
MILIALAALVGGFPESIFFKDGKKQEDNMS